jgi:hypothetical protein
MSSKPFFSKEVLFHNRIPRSASLVNETAKSTDKPIMTVSRVNEELPNLYELYFQYAVDDPTEVTFAEAIFGSVSFWLNFQKSAKLKPYIEEMRFIADAKRKEKAFRAVMKEVEKGGASGFQAAKFLITEPWKGKTAAAKVKKKESTEKAFTSVKSDAQRLKESGLLQ